VINTLQGYRFDKEDILGLQFSYANSNNKFASSPKNPEPIPSQRAHGRID